LSSDSREELLKEFSVYDKAVDIVSCWESSMNYIYADEFDRFYFDRFPSLDAGGKTLTPDFTVFFDESYGLIGEVKRTFPEDRQAIISELEQIANYDDELAIKTGEESYTVPDTCDLIIIIEGSSAPQIGTRFQRIITEEDEFNFSDNPVLIRYHFNQDALMSRYEFQRVTQLEFEFQDDDLETEKSLSYILGEEGEYQTLSVYPKHFSSFKVRKPICNDAPPGQYLATFLWHKIFPEYLNEEEYEIWQATNGQKEIPIEVSVSGMTERVNDYMHDGTVRQVWIRRALDFLCGADLAEEENEDQYSVRFMGFVQDVGEENIQEGSQELDQTRELANIFIRRYCESVTEEQESRMEGYDESEENDDSTEQSGLGDFA
jgi:hypothetical protein